VLPAEGEGALNRIYMACAIFRELSKNQSRFEKLKKGKLFNLFVEESLPWKITSPTFAPKLINTAALRGG